MVRGTVAVVSRRSEAESGVAVQTISEPEIYHGVGFKLREDVRFDSRSLSEGWCPGARTITNLSWEQGQKQKV